MFGERLAHLHRELVKLIDKHQPELVIFEEPFFPIDMGKGKADNDLGFIQGGDAPPPKKGGRARFNPDTIKKLQQVAGCVMTVAALFGIPVEAYASSSWRRTALGFGRIKPTIVNGEKVQADFKKLMKQRARQLGYEPADDNEADALGLLIHAVCGPEATARAQGNLMDMIKL